MRSRLMLPMSWDYEPLKFHVTFSKGLAIQKSDLIDEGIAVVNYGQIHAKSNSGVHLANDLVRYIPLRFALQSASARLHRGDVVYADTSEDINGVGNAVFIDSSGEIFAGYHTLTCRPDGTALLGDYLAFLSQSDWWRAQLRSMVMGVKVYSITKSIMSRVWIPLPPLREQQRIVSRLNSICDEIDNSTHTIEGQISALERYRASVIYEAVTKGLNSDVPMKSSGIDWIGGIPEGWELNKLKYADHFISDFLQENTSPDFKFRYVDIGSVAYGIGIKNYTEMNFGDSPSRARKRVANGDTIVSTVRTYLKAIAMITDDDDLIVSTGFSVIRPYMHLPKYLYYLCCSELFCQQVEKYAWGIAYPAIGEKLLGGIWVPVPPKDVQEDIVSYLDNQTSAIDAVLETKRRQIEVLKRRRQSLIYEYVTGKRRVGKEI